MRLFGLVLSICSLWGCGFQTDTPPSALAAQTPTMGTLRPGIDRPQGVLCTRSDKDFDEQRYPEHIAHCRRDVPVSLRNAVARRYNVPESDFHLYEFDHFIPLDIGGANHIDNLWPQPLAQAASKDRLELQLYEAMMAGTIKQSDAVAKIRAWHP